MLLFCLVIDPVLEKMGTRYQIVAYADDITIAHASNISSKCIIYEVKEALAQLGLQVQNEKCKCTVNGPITFMG